jgi:tripartite-type tricarboxylate transporter receptor subunit TctC
LSVLTVINYETLNSKAMGRLKDASNVIFDGRVRFYQHRGDIVMPTERLEVRGFLIALMILAARGAYGQTPPTSSGPAYPNKSIRIVTSLAGGGNDFAARIMAQGLAAPLGQAVIVDNRGGELAPEIVAKAQPDGYTLLVAGSSFWIGPLMHKSVWDPVKDFAPISFTTTAPNVLIVHASVPVNSVKELIDYAKSKPGTLNYGSSAIGAAAHLSGELFKSLTGVNIVHIPYKGQGAANAAILGGEVQLTFATPASISALLKAGKLKALAVTSAKPTALVPGVPTIAATVPGFQTGSATSILAPARTPAAIINRLNQEVVKLLNQPEVKEKFFNVGVETVGSSPQEFGAAMKSEMARLGKVIKDAGLQEM